MATFPTKKINIFYCYAHEDRSLCNQLEVGLKYLKSIYRLATWSDQEIIAGENWEQAIDTQLSAAHIILLLISPDFMASDYCIKEMEMALAQQRERKCNVISILLRPTHLEEVPFKNLQMLPSDKKPITLWKNRDAAFQNTLEGISKHVKGLEEALLRLIDDFERKKIPDPTVIPLNTLEAALPIYENGLQPQPSAPIAHLSSELEPSLANYEDDSLSQSSLSMVHLSSELEPSLANYEDDSLSQFLLEDFSVQSLANAIEMAINYLLSVRDFSAQSIADMILKAINYLLSTKKGIYVLFVLGFFLFALFSCILSSISSLR